MHLGGLVTTAFGASQSAYSYTAEYTGDSTDLLYLRARYYAPEMGRFLTKDTWAGDANSPTTYNLWQYAHANPVNLNDPSGHDPWWCDTENNPAQCITDWIHSRVTIFSGSSLGDTCVVIGIPATSSTSTSGISNQPDTVEGGLGSRGTTLYRLYNDMWHMKGQPTAWWWQVYGSDGDFTLVDFIATIYIRELAKSPSITDIKGNHINQDDFVEAMGRHAYSWCKDGRKFPKPFTCDSTTNRGLLYFISSWSSIAKGIADACTKGCDLSAHFKDDWPASENWALDIANGIKTPSSSWMQFDKNALWDAGNLHDQVIKPVQVGKMHDIYKHRAYFESSDGLLFLTTYCETLFLHGNTTGFTGEGCVLSPSH